MALQYSVLLSRVSLLLSFSKSPSRLVSLYSVSWRHAKGNLVSISPTFYQQLLHQNTFAKKLQTQIVSKEKLRKKLSYEKGAHKLLVKLTAEQLWQLILPKRQRRRQQFFL
jgi:hypothetical protein